MSARFYINGREVDYRQSELPFSLKRIGDDYLSLIPVDAVVSIDNPAKRIVFPGTPANQSVFEGAHIPSSNPRNAFRGLRAVIYSQGAQVFAGTAVLHGAIARQGGDISYSVGYRGGNQDFYDQLKALKLTQLDLGVQTWDLATIEASWSEDLDTAKAIWAPVYYGRQPNGEPDEFDVGMMRPAIPFKRIIEAISRSTGYRIESTLFETEFFKRHVYLYGSKEQPVTSDFVVQVSKTQRQEVPSGVFVNVIFDSETQDDANVFDPAPSTYTANVPGYYTFSGETFWETDIADQIPLVDLRLRAGNSFFQTLPKDSQWSVGPLLLDAGDTVIVQARGNQFGQTATLSKGFTFRGELVEPTGEGTTISLASTLHDRPAAEFVEGITHLFNLLWRADPVRKVITVDPRHGYAIDGVQQPGMYRTPLQRGIKDISQLIDSTETVLKFSRPFGDYLILGPAEEDGDLYDKASRLGGTSNVPLLCARYDFRSATGEEGETDRNPYFEGLLYKKTGAYVRDMPLVMPDQKDNDDEQLANYGSGPKYALYAGMIDGAAWHWQGSPRTQRPVLYQRPINAGTPLPFNASYTDWYDSSAQANRPGYATRFYRKWLATIDPAKSIKLKVRLPTHELGNPDFSRLYSFNSAGSASMDLWMMVEISGFKPEKQEPPEVLFFRYLESLEGDQPQLLFNLIQPQIDP